MKVFEDIIVTQPYHVSITQDPHMFWPNKKLAQTN